MNFNELSPITKPPKFMTRLLVTDLDPLATAVLPRLIEVQTSNADGAKMLAHWTGTPSLAVNDYIEARRDPTDSVWIVTGASGATASDQSRYYKNPADADLDTNGFAIQFDDATGIEDDSGNEQLLFQKTTSAVNYLEITNAATGNGPSLATNGSDTNAPLTIDAKGSGQTKIATNSTGAVIIGECELGNWEVSSGYAFFGNSALDHSSSANYAFIQSDAGQSIFNIPAGGTSLDLRVDNNTQIFLDSTGAVVIGTAATSPPSANGANVLAFADNISDPTMGSNTAGVYGKDVSGTVELFGIDEAGNATQLTSHNFDLFTPDPAAEYPWSFYAENKFIGKRIGVDMFKLAREVERLGGEKLIYIEDMPAKDRLDWDTVEMEKKALSDSREDEQGEKLPQYQVKQKPNWMQTIDDQ